MSLDKIDSAEANLDSSSKSDNRSLVSLLEMDEFYRAGKNDQAYGNDVIDNFGSLDIVGAVAADFKPFKPSEGKSGNSNDAAHASVDKGESEAKSNAESVDIDASTGFGKKPYEQSLDEEFMLEDGDTVQPGYAGTMYITKKDGTEVAAYPDGSRRTEKPDGTLIIRNADGSSFSWDPKAQARVYKDTEGNSKTEFVAVKQDTDGSLYYSPYIVEYQNKDGSTHTEYVDTVQDNGTVIDENDDRIVTRRPDNTVEIEDKKTGNTSIRRPDGTEVLINKKDGSEVTTRPDGVIETKDRNGNTSIFNPADGSVEVIDSKKGESIKFFKDGSWVSRDKNGKETGSGMDPNCEEPRL